MLRTPNGHVQQSPWLTVANKQMELMARYMSELGLTPSARTKLRQDSEAQKHEPVTFVWRTILDPGDETETIEHVKALELPNRDD